MRNPRESRTITRWIRVAAFFFFFFFSGGDMLGKVYALGVHVTHDATRGSGYEDTGIRGYGG